MREPSWNVTIRTIVLALLIGGASGVLTSALTNNYLSSYALELGELTAPLRLAEERPRAFPQSYEEAVERVTERAVPGLVQFFTPTVAPAVYPPEDAIQSGAVLTSDGWVLTSNASLSLVGSVAVVGREAYSVTEVVVDPALGVQYVKVDASNLPVFAFGRGLDFLSGDQLFVIPTRGALVETKLVDADWRADTVLSSDRPSRRLVLALGKDMVAVGTPVANLSGELVGIVEATEETQAHVVPIDAILPGFTSLLREGRIERPALGLAGVDLAHAVGTSEELAGGITQGVLVYGAAGVARGSAAEAAGIRGGDVITSMGGSPLNGSRTLDEYLLGYEPGANVTFVLLRNGAQQTVTATLAVLE